MLERFIKILVEEFNEKDLSFLLEVITDRITHGFCPLCGEEVYPVDEDEEEILTDDVSHADEWSEHHSEECPVSIIERLLKKKEGGNEHVSPS